MNVNKTRYYDIEGWESECNIPADVIDRNIEIINKSFDEGGRGLKTEVLFQTNNFQINVNYSNMVFAMCVRDILVIDRDFDSGKWTFEEANETIEQIAKFCDFMHRKGIDLLFKIYRTDKGMHAILVNRRIMSDTLFAIKIMVALCNDPFYTAFSRITGFCMRISPKVYRSGSGSLYSRVNNEIIAKEYNNPKYIGYGKSDNSIESMLLIKNSLINFIKKSYRENFNNMTKQRYIPFIDDFKMSPDEEFFNELVDYTKSLYVQHVNSNYEEEEYVYTYSHVESAASEITVYKQDNLSLSYDLYNYVWNLCLSINVIKFHHVNVDKFITITEGLHSSSTDIILISDVDNDEVILLTKGDTTSIIEKIDKDVMQDDKFCLRVSPLLKFDKKNNLMLDTLTQSNVMSSILNESYISIGDNVELKNSLRVISSVRDYLYHLYEDDKSIIEKRLYRQKKTPSYGPSLEIMDDVKKSLLSILEKNSVRKQEKTIDKSRRVNSIRYADILPSKEIKECYVNISYVNARTDMLKQFAIKDCGLNYLYLKGPEYPFVFGQSVYANMVFISLYDIMMLDWDVKLGVTKKSAIEILERFLLSQRNLPENDRLFYREPCFKIYETDNGVHAFLISQLLPHDSEIATKVMLEVCSDINYAAMTRIKGYSIRMSPKVYVNDQYVKPEYIEKQYIQKEGLRIGKQEIGYIGDTDNIDPYILEFTDIIYRTQKHILSYDKQVIYNTLINRDKQIIMQWGDYLSNEYNRMENNIGVQHAAKIWSRDSDNCSRLKSLTFK